MLAATVLIYTVASLASLLAFGIDKSFARQSRRRIPEKALLTLALIGGWPGALLGQQFFHHKTKKVSFQLAFWLCTGLNVAGLYILWSRFG